MKKQTIYILGFLTLAGIGAYLYFQKNKGKSLDKTTDDALNKATEALGASTKAKEDADKAIEQEKKLQDAEKQQKEKETNLIAANFLLKKLLEIYGKINNIKKRGKKGLHLVPVLLVVDAARKKSLEADRDKIKVKLSLLGYKEVEGKLVQINS